MKTELELTFNTGLLRKDEPLLIYYTTNGNAMGPRNKSTVARMVHPEMGGIGFVKGGLTNGGSTYPMDRLELAVKMTLAPEMWNLLSELDKILDSIQSHEKAYQIIALLDGEGLIDKHLEIKCLREHSKKIGRGISHDY